MIPAQAFALKKYFGGTSRVSKASDKKDTAASLGHSEELRVENSPRQAVPDFIHFPQQLSESRPALARQRSRDVLPHKVSRTELANSSYVLEHEAGRSGQPFALSCDAERLAGAPTDHNVNFSNV